MDDNTGFEDQTAVMVLSIGVYEMEHQVVISERECNAGIKDRRITLLYLTWFLETINSTLEGLSY